jgi:hypothetical protein
VRDKLERLRDETQADTMAEVVRRSLAVYDLMWKFHREGSQIIVKDVDGNEMRVIIPI